MDNNLSTEYDKQIFSVLDFWAKNMNSDTMKTLDLFFNSNLVVTRSSDITCGCSGSTGTTLSYNLNDNSLLCNPLDDYKKKNITMTEYIFSDIYTFWKEYFSTDMINWTISYLKNIIKCNLPLNFNYTNVTQFSCSQVTKEEQIQKEYQQIINDIIISLELLRDCEENKQYNWVNKALNNFSKIYPYLYWN